MIKFEQLNEHEQMAVRNSAMKWFHEHKSHVSKLVSSEKAKVAPTGSDLYRPELWKALHWRWFLDNSFIL